MRFLLAVCLVISMAGFAQAQNTAAPKPDEKAAPARAAPPATQTAEEPEITKNGDWFVACRNINGKDGPTKVCEMQQTLEEKASGQPFVRIFIAYIGDGEKPTLRLFTPLGSLLRPGVTLQIDSGKALRLPYQVCLTKPPACIVEGVMENDIISAMKRGNGGTLGVVLLGNRNVEVPFSLKGFTKSIKSLK
ncbi:MAG: invasion associated locus B family protein [Alphaproteobacteria bacterium]